MREAESGAVCWFGLKVSLSSRGGNVPQKFTSWNAVLSVPHIAWHARNPHDAWHARHPHCCQVILPCIKCEQRNNIQLLHGAVEP